MADDFENHCWKDIVPPDVLDIYSHYHRKTFVGPSPALLAIDLYEMAYQGGAKPVAQLHKTLPLLLAHVAQAGRTLTELSTHHATLEDVFVSLTGRQLRD